MSITSWPVEPPSLTESPADIAAADFDVASFHSVSLRPDSSVWADYLSACFSADWACYTAPVDRADQDRLFAMINGFPAGFTLYLARAAGRLMPVGYTGWYPIARSVFHAMATAPETLAGRGAMRPLPQFSPGDPVYMFNYSLVPPLHKTAASRQMLSFYADSMNALPHGGLAAVTVSEAGARFATRLGLSPAGLLIHDDDAERIYLRMS